MSEVRCFSLIGDSNIRNHVNKNSFRANPALKTAQILSCGNVNIFAETLGKVRPESNTCIVACISNFITRTEGAPSISQRVEPVLQDVREAVHQFCEAFPDRALLLSPPMYRSAPIWYREGLSEVMGMFSQVFGSERPVNLHLLPSFATPEFDADGVHLTPYSGLEYITHLFDSTQHVLENLTLDTDQCVSQTCETTRVLEDRVMVLEQDHRRLNKVVERKTALDAEIDAFHENERMEDWFVIYGLSAIPDEFVGKAWQERALRDVKAVLLILMGSEMASEIIFVKNSTARHKDAEITYSVKMVSAAVSSTIRRKFGAFFVGGVDKRPEDLKPYNIKNWVTPETKIRVSILKLLAKRYRASNPGAKVQVISYDPRPQIRITPPSGADDRRVKNYFYVDAVSVLPTNFSTEEITPIIRRVNPKLFGQIRSIFVVLSDDLFKKVTSRFSASKASASAPDAQPDTTPVSNTSNTSASGSSGKGSGSSSGNRSRSLKRGASSQGGGPPKK